MKLTTISYKSVSDILSEMGGFLKIFQLAISAFIMLFLGNALKQVIAQIRRAQPLMTAQEIREQMNKRFSVVFMFEKLGMIEQQRKEMMEIQRIVEELERSNRAQNENQSTEHASLKRYYSLYEDKINSLEG